MEKRKIWWALLAVVLAVIVAFSLISCTPLDDNGDGDTNGGVTDNGSSDNGGSDNGSGVTPDSSFVFELGEDDYYSISSYNGSEKRVVIPALYEGKAVTRIDSNAFANNTTLESITIPNSVIRMEKNAFKDCSSIKSVYVDDISVLLGIKFVSSESNPLSNGADLYAGGELFTTLALEEGVTAIKNYAFYNCTSLKSIVLPSSLQEIGENAFTGVKIESADIWGNHANYFRKDDLKTLLLNGKRVYNSFKELSKLETVILKEGVEEIDGDAFYNCRSLKKIVLPTTLKKIGNDAFGCVYARQIEEIHISDLSSFFAIERGNTFSLPMLYVNKLYLNDQSISEIVVPDTVTEIDDYTFYGAKFLKKIVLGDNITRIGEWAFARAENLEELVFGNSKGINIGQEAFSVVPKVSVTVPSLEIWMSYNFLAPGASPLTSTQIANRLKIGNEFFDGNLVVPEKITAIGDYAFEGVSNMKSITIHDGVTGIGNYAFYGCGEVDSVIIGESVKTVGESVFAYCRVENMVIKADFESVVGGGLGCAVEYLEATNNSYGYVAQSALVEVVINGEGALVGGFNRANDLKKVTIGEGITKLSNEAFSSCEALTDIVLPSTIDEIETFAFVGCTLIENINFPASLRIIGGGAMDSTAWYKAQPDGVVYAGGVLLKYKGEGENISVTVKEGTRGIAEGAFAGIGLVELNVPDTTSLEYVGGGVIDDTPYLASLPDGAVYIGSCLVNFKGAVEPNTKLVIADGTTMICDSVFNSTSVNNLVEIVLPESLEYIGGYNFSYVDKLFKLTLPKNLEYLHKQAFYGCYNLVEICNLSDIELTSDYAVMQYVKNVYTEEEGQSKLEIVNDFVIYTEGEEKTLIRYYGTETKVVVPFGVTIIGTGSIADPETTQIILPSSVKIVKNDAFYKCKKLELIVFQKGIESIGRNVLYSSGMLDVSLDVKFTGTEEEWKAIEKSGWIYFESYAVMEYEYEV